MPAVALLAVVACSGGKASAPAGPDAAMVKAAPDAAAAPAPDRWATTAAVGAELRDFVVTFDGATATLAVEGATLPLADVTYAADRIAFTLEKPGAPESSWERFELTRTGDRAEGTDRIGGVSLPVRMVKLAAGEPPRSAYPRPQTPRPPFPYRERELVVDAPGGARLAGTLTVPEGAGPFPVVIFLSGSGQQDRDETIFGHKPFLFLADRLTRAGIATYRFDDRGTGATVGPRGTLDTEIADAAAVVDAIAAQPELDPDRIGLIGHSAAGMVVPNVALTRPVKYAVLLAGCTRNGRVYAAYQTERAARAAGADDAAIAEQQALQARLTDAAVESPEAARAVLVELVTPQLEAALGRAPTAAEIDEAIAAPLAEATDPWYVSYFRIEPTEAWKQLSIPVLLLVGGKDTQVPADLTIDALAGAVRDPALLTARKLDGLNHLFQRAGTGEVDEYLTLEETFDPAAAELVTSWLVERTR
jgi:hypothetical protein